MTGTAAPIAGPYNWDEVYHKELGEVYLLLDFIAGRPDKKLTSLDIDMSEDIPDQTDPAKKTTVTRKLTAPEIAQRISALRFPQQGSALKQSEDAALLLLVKDRLCALAYPATAQSIAFTGLVASKSASQSLLWPLPRFRRRPVDQHQSPEPERISIGRRAYPDLDDIASSFCRFRRIAICAAVVLALVGALLLANATYGGQLTSRLQVARRDAAAAAASIYLAYTATHPPVALSTGKLPESARVQKICPLAVDTAAARAPASASPEPGGASLILVDQTKGPGTPPLDQTLRGDLPGNVDAQLIQLCDAYAYAAASLQNAIDDVDAYARSWTAHAVSIVVPIHTLGFPTPECDQQRDQTHCGAKQETGPSVSGMVSAFANYILPLIFGLVGAVSGLIRIIQDKITDSILVPRDRSLLALRLLLGGVAGGSVGLFFDPSKVANDISAGNSGLSVSASGIAFLAGYGAPAFFGMLDLMLVRLFDFRDDRRSAGAAQPGRTG